MNMSQVVAKIEALERQKQEFLLHANQQVAFMDGQLAALREMIEHEGTPDSSQEQDATGD